jgi:ADP-heptose:LPS heptosyltransferase
MNLFILESALGDALLTTGIIDKLKDEPAVILATPRSAGLFEDLPNLKKLIVLKKKPWKKEYYDAWKEIKDESWNHIIDFRRTFYGPLLKGKVKFKRNHSNKITTPIHKVLQISRALGSSEPLNPTLWISKERQARIKKAMGKRRTFAVGPVASWIGKQWPLENFTEMLKKFCKKYPDAQVAIFAAPHERKFVEPLLKALPQDQLFNTYDYGLLDIGAVIKNSDLFIGNDSGLMHVSAAVKTPTIAMFGPSDENAYGPWSDKNPTPHQVLRGDPFTGNVPQEPSDTNCYMTSLKVSPVWEAVQEMWEK